MRRLNKSRTESKKKPTDVYAEFGKPSSAESRSTGSGVSFASYDDLFSAKASDDAESWKEFEDNLAGSKTRGTGKKKKKKAPPPPPPESDVDPDSDSFNDDDDDDEFSVSSEALSISHASFEDVFGRRVFQEGSEQDEEFEFSNPSGWNNPAATKEAVYDVLTQKGSPMQKARKLYVLEQLNRAAPPSEAPSYWARPGVLGNNRASRRRKVKGYYEIPAPEDGGTVSEAFWGYGEAVQQLEKMMIEWQTRLCFLLDLAKHIGKFHQGGFTHGSLRSEALILDDHLTLHIKGVKSIRQLTKAEFKGEQRVTLQRVDILGIGIVILETSTSKLLSQITAPKLKSAIKLEEKGKFDKLEELQDAVDQELRDILHAVNAPQSLIELCVQCISPFRESRPTADDVIEWLADLKDDMADPNVPPNTKVALAFKANKKLALKGHKMFNMQQVPDLGEEDEDGYETDDSYLPPEDAKDSGGVAPQEKAKNAAKQGGDGGGNKLQAFLKASGDVPHLHSGANTPGSVGGKARPKSMMLPTKVGTSTEVNKEEESEQPKRLRRRSLDRGYYYARERLMESDKRDASRLVSKANMSKFKQQWQEKKQQALDLQNIDPESLAKRFEEQEVLSQDEAIAIITKADKVLRQEPNLVQLDTQTTPNIVVVGDIHGQFYDLRNMIKLVGEPGKGKGKATYLFLGDFVDRGDWGCEVMLYLLSLKFRFPGHVWLLRGNHEARTVSSYFGFKEECERKYGLAVFNRFTEMFQALPIAATVETPAGKWLALHGGISPNVRTLEQFIEFDRFAEPAMNGFLCDILWSDPVKDTHEDGQIQTLADFLSIDFLPNPQRGCSYRYGFRAIVSFLAQNGLVGLMRAHEVQEEGYLYHYVDMQSEDGSKTGHITPPVITIFSAPNYCGRYGNKAAVMRVHHKVPGRRLKRLGAAQPMQLLEPYQFLAVPHPDPIQIENEQRKQTNSIEETCPYMPTTFQAFIAKATQLGEQVARKTGKIEARRGSLKGAKEIRKQKGMTEVAPPLPPRIRREGSGGSLDGGERASERPDKPPPPPRKNWKAAALLGFDDPGGAATGPGGEPRVGSGSTAKKEKKKKKKKNKKFEEAAQQDGINELNPLLIQDKMKQAQTKLNPDELKLPDKVRVQGSGNKRSSLLKAASAKDVRERAGTLEGKKADQDAITFSTNELISLQLLFLFIDQADKGYITREDLVQWSAEDGYAVPKSEAETCLIYVDSDGDGKIGFEDYLVFAAKAKERWLIREYNEVVGHIKQLEK